MQLRWPTWFFHGIAKGLTLPSQCWVCHSWPCADLLCPDCLHRFTAQPFRCTGCALALPGLSAERPRCGACLHRPPLWQQAHAWVDYAYPWNGLIAQWKFHSHPALAAALARWMCATPSILQALQSADCVMPIPLSNERLRARGYNQAALLAKALAPHACQLHTLRRIQHTTAQHDLSRAQRLRNLRHAFEVAPAYQHLLCGQRVLLVDDVMTTGATLHAATRCLLQAGAAQVDVLCVARTP